ncbi:MAG: hypothetical protein AVDCRST_MAG02-4030, partial [uncultured Rubrobacteraceae bacterium]
WPRSYRPRVLGKSVSADPAATRPSPNRCRPLARSSNAAG